MYYISVYVRKRNEIVPEDTANGFLEGRWKGNVVADGFFNKDVQSISPFFQFVNIFFAQYPQLGLYQGHNLPRTRSTRELELEVMAPSKYDGRYR